MSFHAPLPTPSGSSSQDAPARRVGCDLPAMLDLLPGEVDLIELWFAEMIADLSGGGGGTAITEPDNAQIRKMT